MSGGNRIHLRSRALEKDAKKNNYKDKKNRQAGWNAGQMKQYKHSVSALKNQSFKHECVRDHLLLWFLKEFINFFF